MDLMRQKSVKLFLIFVLSVPLRAVTVSPALCPTNKIAPHRHVKRWDWEYQPRTFGAFYDLLAPGPGFNQGYDPNLQEEPQKDDPDDCGDIEDYDEHDLSSLNRNGYGNSEGAGDGRLFFGLFNGGNPPNQHRPPYRPQQPQPQQPPHSQPQYPPQRPPRPPYASGGYFENNPYRPPIQHSPSDEIKPVHDGVYEPQTTYRPNVVGGPISHVVGVAAFPVRPQYRPMRPTYRSPDQATTPEPTTQRPYTRYPQRPQVAQTSYKTTRRPRPRQLNEDSGIFGSFLDLLFK